MLIVNPPWPGTDVPSQPIQTAKQRRCRGVDRNHDSLECIRRAGFWKRLERVKRAERVSVPESPEGAKLERTAQVGEGNAGWNRPTVFCKRRSNARHRSVRDGQKNDVRRR